MKRIPIFPVALQTFAGVIVALVANQTFATEEAIDSADKAFIQSAYKDGLAEIRMAEEALTKSANPEVKAFAEKMAADHGRADNNLETLAVTKKVSLATGPGLVTQTKAKLLDSYRGATFNKEYMENMVNAHKAAVAEFEKEANEAKDPDVRAFAAKTLPTLREHLAMAEELKARLEK